MGNNTPTTNGTADIRTKTATTTTPIMLHTGRWRPGAWQYALIDVIATAHGCTTARGTDRAVNKRNDTVDYGRVINVTGTSRAVANVAADYAVSFDAMYRTARMAFVHPDPECNPDALEWGPFVNSFCNGAVRRIADVLTVANTIAERSHAATVADGAAMADAMIAAIVPSAMKRTATATARTARKTGAAPVADGDGAAPVADGDGAAPVADGATE